MNTVLKGLTAAAFVAGVFAAPAAAQQKSWGFGLHGSWLSSGSLAEAEPSDTDLKLDDGWTIGGGLEWWFGSRRVGLRLDGAYANEPWVLQFGESSPFTNAEESDAIVELNQFGQLSSYFADASLMLRLLPTTAGRRFAPFVSIGTGLIHWDHEGEDTDLSLVEADAYIYGEDQTEWALAGGIGADIFFTESIALRLEAKDYWNSDSPYLVLSDSDRDHEGGHNVMWRAGLQFNFGGARVVEPGFVAAPPPPPAAPAPAPPATERVAMCVVDANGRLQTVDAVRYIDNGNVYVTRNGQEVLFTTAYPVTEPYYVRGAPWYIANRPLVLALGADDMGGDVDDELDDAIEDMEDMDRVEFVRFGSTGPLPMGDVLYVGSMDGTGLYAKRSDIGSLLPELERRLAVTRDLDEILDDEEFADRFVNEIETFYLAVEPGSANCVFQPVSSTRVVRRTNG